MKDVLIEKIAAQEEENWWFIGRSKIISSIMENYIGLKSNLKILDVGCGAGYTTFTLTKFGNVYGMDYSFQALKYSNKRGLDKVLKSSVYALPFQTNTFDVITMFDSLEHMANDLEVLKELKRILKKDGMIFISVPAFQFLWSIHDVVLSHFRRYNSKSLASVLIRAGFKNIWSSYFMSFLFPIVAISKLVDRKKTNKENNMETGVEVPKIINKILKKLLFFENTIIKKMKMPFGLSLFCVAKINSDKSFS